MEEEDNKQTIEKVPLTVTGFSDDDIQVIETSEGLKNLLDIKRAKLSRGAELIEMHDEKLGLSVVMQSYKENIKKINNLALKLFKKLKKDRNKDENSSYTG